MGVTQNPLPVLGSVYMNVFIGARVHVHLFYVVPDKLLDTDVLLGADLLGVAPLTWDCAQNLVTWDKYTYSVTSQT